MQDDSPDSDEAIRAKLLSQIEKAQNSLDRQLAELRRTDSTHLHNDVVAQGAAKLLQLSALHDQLALGADGVSAAALSTAVTAAVSASQSYAADARSAVGSAEMDTSAQVLSMVDYQQQAAEWDRKVAQSYAEEGNYLAYARDVARRYGIDISGYEKERTDLERERDEARGKGDKLGERKADALIAENTYNTMAGELNGIIDPAERAKHLEEMREQQRIVEQRRDALKAQIALEAKRKAAELHLTGDAAKTYTDQFEKEQLDDYDKRRSALKTSDSTEAARTELKTAVVAGAANDVPTDTKPAIQHPIAAALTPEAQAKVQQAASVIRSDFGKSSGGLADFGDGPEQPSTSSQPSTITLDTSSNAQQVVVPLTKTQTNAGKPASPPL